MLGIITVTPLQLVIAQKVITDQSIGIYCLLNINAYDKPILRSKYNILSKNAQRSDYLILNGTGFQNFKQVASVIRAWKNLGVTKLLLSSIDNIFVQYAIAKIHPVWFETFDDGAINIILSGCYHKIPQFELRQRLLYYFIRGSCDQKYIRSNTRQHYTIYNIGRNIVEKKKLSYVSVFSEVDKLPCLEGMEERVVRVFVGFSLEEQETYIDIVVKLDADYYIQHPMEKPDERIKNIVDAYDLAEFIIKDLLGRYDIVELYSCNSSVLLNMDNIRLKKYVIDLYNGTNNWQNEYNEVAKMLNCTIMPVNSFLVDDDHLSAISTTTAAGW